MPAPASAPAPALRIGDVARAAHVPVSLVRFYTEQGLVRARPRPKGSKAHRLFDEDVVDVVRAIRIARALGFPLPVVRAILAPTPGRTPAATPAGGGRAVTSLMSQSSALDRAVEHLGTVRQHLQAAIEALRPVANFTFDDRASPEAVAARLVASLLKLPPMPPFPVPPDRSGVSARASRVPDR